jgi:hypothetical protein
LNSVRPRCGLGEIPVVIWMFLQRHHWIRIRGDLEDLLFSDGPKKITTHSQFLRGKERYRIYCNIQDVWAVHNY